MVAARIAPIAVIIAPKTESDINDFILFHENLYEAPNGLRYLRWGGDGEAVRLEK